MDFWAWFSASVPAGALINGGGLLALAGLFASDRILTKGQHERRMADRKESYDLLTKALTDSHSAAIAELAKHHAVVLAEKEARYTELEKSRDYYRDGRIEERDRADKVTDQLAAGFNEFGQLTTHLLQSFDEAAKDVRP